MATQSIIVYRNPLEQQFWESGMILPLFVFIVASAVFILATTTLVQIGLRSVGYNPNMYRSHSNLSDTLNYVAIGVSVVLAGTLAYHFVI